MSSNTASVIEVIIIGYSICTEYKVLSQSSTVVSLFFCTEYQLIGYVRYTVFKSVTCFQIPNNDQDTASYKLSSESQGHITGHIKLTKSTSVSFSLSVYTVYFCCAAIPPVPLGEKVDIPAAAAKIVEQEVQRMLTLLQNHWKK